MERLRRFLCMNKMSPPVLEKDSTVLVTGVNGFIASHIADQLLQDGYAVRGSVRSQAKGKALVDFFRSSYGDGRFEVVVVEDITEDGAFDEALEGMITFLLPSVADPLAS